MQGGRPHPFFARRPAAPGGWAKIPPLKRPSSEPDPPSKRTQASSECKNPPQNVDREGELVAQTIEKMNDDELWTHGAHIISLLEGKLLHDTVIKGLHDGGHGPHRMLQIFLAGGEGRGVQMLVRTMQALTPSIRSKVLSEVLSTPPEDQDILEEEAKQVREMAVKST